jgi:hypothetical protein
MVKGKVLALTGLLLLAPSYLIKDQDIPSYSNEKAAIEKDIEDCKKQKSEFDSVLMVYNLKIQYLKALKKQHFEETTEYEKEIIAEYPLIMSKFKEMSKAYTSPEAQKMLSDLESTINKEIKEENIKIPYSEKAL